MGQNRTLRDISTSNKKRNKEKEIVYYKRDFLNTDTHGSFAAILGSIYISKYYDEKGRLSDFYKNTSLSITDCTKRIDLELESSNEYLENSLHKLDRIIEVASNMKTALVKANRLSLELQAELDEANMQRKEEENAKTGTKESSGQVQ